MPKAHRYTLEVRGYELDSYAHVNHAVYLSYLEQARWKLLQEEKVSLADLGRWQRWPVIAEIQAKYIKPAFMGDLLEVRTSVVEHSRTSVTFEQDIFRAPAAGASEEPTTIFKARVRVVIINEKGRPADTPPELSRLWEGLGEPS